MNRFQNITALICLLCIGMTLAVLFVCFATPFSHILITETAALILSEIILGCIGIYLFAESHKTLPYSLSLWGTGFLYFFFVLIMIYPANGDISTKKFILSHSLGLASAVILFLIFLMGKFSIQRTAGTENAGMANKEMMLKKMQKVHLVFETMHPQEKQLLSEGEKFLDSLRFIAVSSAAPSSYDVSILCKMECLEEIAASRNVQEYRKKLHELFNLLTLREKELK